MRLGGMVERQTPCRLAVTGGRAVQDIHGTVPGLSWERLTADFLAN